MALCHESLSNHYKTNFQLTLDHNRFSLAELEEMFPFEREVYIALLNLHIKEKNQRNKQS